MPQPHSGRAARPPPSNRSPLDDYMQSAPTVAQGPQKVTRTMQEIRRERTSCIRHPSRKSQDLKVKWHPFELRCYPTPTLRTEDPYLPAAWKSSVYPMAERLGVSIKLPSISPQPSTHLAFEGHFFAQESAPEKTSAYNVAVLQAFFQQERDVGEFGVLADIAGQVGLDKMRFREALVERRYPKVQGEAVEHALDEAAITAGPTMYINGKRLASGVPTQALLQRALDTAAVQ